MVGGPAARSVIVLRHPARAVRVADALRAAELSVFALPLTETELPRDVDAVLTGLAALARGEYRWLVVTSGNTVQALDTIGRARAVGLAAAVAAGGTRVAAVGAATARLLADAGVAVDLVPDDATSAGLLRTIGRGHERILLPQADLAPDDLRAGLTGLGWRVERIEAYRTVPYPAHPSRRVPGVVEDGVPPPLLVPGDVVGLAAAGVQPAVVFTAPSTVQQFRERLAAGPLAFHPVAIGPTTAAALRGQGWEPGATATGPTPSAIRAAVLEAFGTEPVTLPSGRPVSGSKGPPAGPAPAPPSAPTSAPTSARTSAPTSAPPIGDQP